MKDRLNYFFSIFFIMMIVGFYQVPQIQEKLNYYGINYDLNLIFPLGKNIQNWIEKNKINVENNFNYHKKDIEILEIVDKENKKEIIFNNQINNNLEKKELTSTIKNKCYENCKVLLAGDSIVGDIYYSFNRLAKKEIPGWKIIDGHKVSSGLSNNNYYNWSIVLKNLIDANHPDYIIFLIGTNDAQGLIEENKAFKFSSDRWKEIYSKRVNDIVSQIGDINYYWIELPQSGNNNFNSQLNIIRKIQENNIDSVHYFKTFDLLKNKKEEIKDFRQKDLIHLNSKASDLLAKEILQKFK